MIIVSCQKDIDRGQTMQEEFPTSANQSYGHLKKTETYDPEVLLKWFDLKYRILQTPQELTAAVPFYRFRYYAYTGIALYESVVPGMPAYQSLSGQLSNMPAMPATIPGVPYHWPTCANAALAFMHKSFLPNTSAANKASMDSLEQSLNIKYEKETNAATFQRSVEFGKEVARRVFDWSKTDGIFNVNPPYIPPVGPGLWVSTPPGFLPAEGPYIKDLRALIPGIVEATVLPPPVPYSTNPGSDFFMSMKEVYDTSLSLTPDKITHATYWRGTMGGTAIIHWYAIMKKVMLEQGTMLDKAALAYCKMGIVFNDADISAYDIKYQYNQLTPITYIRNIMGHDSWNSVFPTLSHPGYPELVSTGVAASAAVLSNEFGNNYHFNTDGTHNLGLPGYSFNSFEQAALHAGLSRLYAGVSSGPAIEAGILLGNKTVQYLETKIKFLKD